jgi:urea transport system permease protein
VLYFVNGGLLIACILVARFILSSKVGKLLLALKDKEDRVRFSGYDVSNFKIFVSCVAAVFAALGGAMFTLQVGFMSPSFVGIVPSIEMVIFAAVGGRMSLIGAAYGTLLVNFGKTYFSESFPEMWLFLMGALFIGFVMAFPNGLAGILKSDRLLSIFRKPTPSSVPTSTVMPIGPGAEPSSDKPLQHLPQEPTPLSAEARV